MEIRSYNELKRELQAIGCIAPNSGQCFYRGLPDENLDLIPSLYYKPFQLSPKAFEKAILNDFKNHSGIITSTTGNTIIWTHAFLARHYGLRLRIMDWTIDISAAINFMQSVHYTNGNAALYILPKYPGLRGGNEIYQESYFDYDKTAMLNPPEFLENIKLIGYKNRFHQSGKFLIQDYDSARNCFYKRNNSRVHKILIPQSILREMYIECCADLDYDPQVPLFIKDHLTYLSETLNDR